MADLTQRALPTAASRLRSAAVGLKSEASSLGFGFLVAFFVVYCGRPEDWIPGLKYIPVAKVTAGGATWALLTSRHVRIRLKDLPREFHYLLALTGVLAVSALCSPVWKGGAMVRTFDFSKILVVFLLVYLLVSDIRRLRQLMFVQAASMISVTLVSVVKGYHTPRLDGVIGGIFSNPNDLAFAIVLCIPYCLALLITTKSILGKLSWMTGILIMLPALFLTASRAGFIDLVISGTVVLWHFGVKGRRMYLIVVTGFLGVLLLSTVGHHLMHRFEAINEATKGDDAYGSFEAREMLMRLAVQGIEHYPILGIGANDFPAYSGTWQPVHMTYLQICVEGGIPSLILYLLIFWCAFRNLRGLLKQKDLPEDYRIYAGAIHSSLVGFVVGALFSPEAYHFFPFFSVTFTSAMVAMVARRNAGEVAAPVLDWRQRRKAMNLWWT
jgi:hypothetical protein